MNWTVLSRLTALVAACRGCECLIVVVGKEGGRAKRGRGLTPGMTRTAGVMMVACQLLFFSLVFWSTDREAGGVGVEAATANGNLKPRDDEPRTNAALFGPSRSPTAGW